MISKAKDLLASTNLRRNGYGDTGGNARGRRNLGFEQDMAVVVGFFLRLVWDFQ